MRDHDKNSRIETLISSARTMIQFGYTETECVRVLMADRALEHEAINAIRAAVILNEHEELND